jgi:hypothetical protein
MSRDRGADEKGRASAHTGVRRAQEEKVRDVVQVARPRGIGTARTGATDTSSESPFCFSPVRYQR